MIDFIMCVGERLVESVILKETSMSITVTRYLSYTLLHDAIPLPQFPRSITPFDPIFLTTYYYRFSHKSHIQSLLPQNITISLNFFEYSYFSAYTRPPTGDTKSCLLVTEVIGIIPHGA